MNNNSHSRSVSGDAGRYKEQINYTPQLNSQQYNNVILSN